MQPFESEVNEMLKGSEKNAEWTFVDIKVSVRPLSQYYCNDFEDL